MGASVDDEVIDFLNGASNDGGTTRSLFAALGERLVARTREEELRTSLAEEADARAHAEEQLRAASEARAAAEHVRALLAMRRFRYTRAVWTAYERVRHPWADSVSLRELTVLETVKARVTPPARRRHPRP